ncbi:hypothetical protein AMECASPLE_015396 [Ameca splendens]|uniref:Uncharacterized protein n=1 Tax=Ameca splendens TaxID=208324 RepID=A0ABV0Y1R0_9TELE
MNTKATVICTCSLVISLIVESYHAQKLNIHWGPQSMMYLKGKYGKRFVLEDDTSVLKQSLQGLNTLIQEKTKEVLRTWTWRQPAHGFLRNMAWPWRHPAHGLFRNMAWQSGGSRLWLG